MQASRAAGLEAWRDGWPRMSSGLKTPAVALVNKRIASQQGCRPAGLGDSSLEAWRAGWQLASQDGNGLKRAAVAPVNKRIASQRGWRTGGLEGLLGPAAWRPGGLAGPEC